MNSITKTKAQEISKLITLGIDSWTKAGEILVDMLDNAGLSLGDISEEIGISSGILGRFEQIGRRQIMPNLLIADYPASRFIAKLPYSEQERMAHESVEVLTSDGSDMILVSPKNLTPNQCRQVFSPSGVRDTAGQRAWIESSKRKKETKDVVSGMSYRLEKNQVIFDKGCVMKLSQLLSIVSQLAPK